MNFLNIKTIFFLFPSSFFVTLAFNFPMLLLEMRLRKWFSTNIKTCIPHEFKAIPVYSIYSIILKLGKEIEHSFKTI